MSTNGKNGQPFLIGICGGSASGKTTGAYFITKYLGEENCLLFSLDNYFYGPNEEEMKHLENYNFDRPEALDLDLAYKHLLQLKNGEEIQMPVYNFNKSRRLNYTKKVSPKNVIIFEGIFALHEKRMRDLMDLKLFFDLDSDIRLMRRISRDISDRSRKIDTVLTRYITFVKPAFELYIKPTRKYADFVIPSNNFTSLPLEIISQLLDNTLVGIKPRKGSMLSRDNSNLSNKLFEDESFFFDPQISCLSVVKEQKDINKFNKIIYYVIGREKISYYSLFGSMIVDYLLETRVKKNKEKLHTYYLDETQLTNYTMLKEALKYENGEYIICIFAPFLMEMKEKFRDDLIKFINAFDKNLKIEILSVYLSYNTFNQINEALAMLENINYFTIYFGDELMKYKTILENGGFFKNNSADLLHHFLTFENLIGQYHESKNKLNKYKNK